MLAFVKHHLAEGQVVVDGRDQTPGAGRECGRAAPLAALGLVVEIEGSGSGIGPVTGREPVELRSRHAEAAVLHAERLEEALAEEHLQRLGRSARDQHTQHVGPRVVHPLLARLVHERQGPEATDPLIRLGRRRRARRTLAKEDLLLGLLDRIRVRRSHDEAEAQAEGQQVAHRDRPVRRHGLVERPVEPLQHLAVGQLGQQPIHRLVQSQLAFLHQDHRRRGRERLGHRGDAEDRVATHRVAAADRLEADRIDMRLAAPADQRDDARHVAALDIAGHDLVHAAEPRLGQSSGARRLIPPFRLIREDKTRANASPSGRGGLKPWS